jgi:hypothetical protein
MTASPNGTRDIPSTVVESQGVLSANELVTPSVTRQLFMWPKQLRLNYSACPAGESGDPMKSSRCFQKERERGVSFRRRVRAKWCPVVARQDILDIKAELLNQTALVTNEVGDGGTTGLPSDPGQRTNVTLDFKLDIDAEHGGDLRKDRRIGLCACPVRFQRRDHALPDVGGSFAVSRAASTILLLVNGKANLLASGVCQVLHLGLHYGSEGSRIAHQLPPAPATDKIDRFPIMPPPPTGSLMAGPAAWYRFQAKCEA